MFTRRGYNDVYGPWGCTFPNNLQPTQGAPALTWDEFGQQVRGLTLRVKFTGRNGPLGQANVLSFEPGGYYSGWGFGQYNHWPDLDEFLAVCRQYDVSILALPFENEEWRVDNSWYRHAWNAANGGPLVDPARVLVDVGAIDAAKRRLDAIAEAAGEFIVGWELAEFTQLFTTDFFGVPFSGLERIVLEQGVPWVEDIFAYIHTIHPAPVGCGIVDKIGAAREFVNEICRVPSADFATLNWYGDEDAALKMPRLRRAQAYTTRACYCTQYATWSIGGIVGYERDDYPFPRHMEHEWAARCARSLGMGWPEASANSVPTPWWGVAHPNLATIANVTKAFCEDLDPDDWQGMGQAWDTHIQGDSLHVISSQSDSRHVTAFCDWADTGIKTVAVDGLSQPLANVKCYDFLTGAELSSTDVPTIDGIALFDVPTVGTRGIFHLSPVAFVPPPVYTLRVRATVVMDGENVRTFEGEMEEVVP